MKSAHDIHLAIAALAMLTFRSDTAKGRELARKSASMLCWVMDYPNDFDKFMDGVKSHPMFKFSKEELDRLVKEAIESGNLDEGFGE